MEGHIQYQRGVQVHPPPQQWPSDYVKVMFEKDLPGVAIQDNLEVIQLCDLRVSQQGSPHRAPLPVQRAYLIK